MQYIHTCKIPRSPNGLFFEWYFRKDGIVSLRVFHQQFEGTMLSMVVCLTSRVMDFNTSGMSMGLGIWIITTIYEVVYAL